VAALLEEAAHGVAHQHGIIHHQDQRHVARHGIRPRQAGANRCRAGRNAGGMGTD
jgi:hypothetical protein